MKSKKFTIFGDPVEHSISPKMHTLVIEGLSLDANYTKTHLLDGSNLKEIFLEHYDGANVTVPHKETAYQQCDEVVGIASKIQAVNTLIKQDGKMIGYNTDAQGFYESIKEFLPLENVLILGAGGTAKALSFIFREHGVNVTVLNRSENRLSFFQDAGFETATWSTLEPKPFDLVVNTTSAGLQEEAYPAPLELLEKILQHTKCAADVIYNKKTPFLSLVEKYNIPYKDGADMLLYQGVLAFNLFYNNQFDFEEITKYMKKVF
jgi:shikimate dehydrogenase